MESLPKSVRNLPIKNPAKIGRELSINQGASTNLVFWGCDGNPESRNSNLKTIFGAPELHWLGLSEPKEFR